jgi:adenylate kinase
MYNGNVILLGKPGSGKGTLATQLKEKYKYTVITAGDLLRVEKKSGSEIGQKINNLIGKGNLVPDELISELVDRELNRVRHAYVLDGFPRTINQGEFLEKKDAPGLVIYLDVTDDTIRKRILERGKTSGRDDDQELSIINKRIRQFKSDTEPLVDFYKKRKTLAIIDGESEIEEVFNQAENLLRLWR